MINIRGFKTNNFNMSCSCVCPLCLHLLSWSLSGCYNVTLESGKYLKDRNQLFTVLDDEDLNHVGPGSSVRSLTSSGGAISEVGSQWILLTRCPAHMDTLMSLLGFVADICKHRGRMIGGPCHQDKEESCPHPWGQRDQLDYKPLSRIIHSLEISGWLADTRRGAEGKEREQAEEYA